MSITGVLCLQGGRELTPPCAEMDAAVLARSNGRVVVLAGAARIGSDYAERRWSLPDGLVWGLPECGGVIIDGDQMTAVGHGHPSVRVDGEWRRVARFGTEPLPH